MFIFLVNAPRFTLIVANLFQVSPEQQLPLLFSCFMVIDYIFSRYCLFEDTVHFVISWILSQNTIYRIYCNIRTPSKSNSAIEQRYIMRYLCAFHSEKCFARFSFTFFLEILQIYRIKIKTQRGDL
jgi:hypothetical protein